MTRTEQHDADCRRRIGQERFGLFQIHGIGVDLPRDFSCEAAISRGFLYPSLRAQSITCCVVDAGLKPAPYGSLRVAAARLKRRLQPDFLINGI